jgi:hypothetical protein
LAVPLLTVPFDAETVCEKTIAVVSTVNGPCPVSTHCVLPFVVPETTMMLAPTATSEALAASKSVARVKTQLIELASPAVVSE